MHFQICTDRFKSENGLRKTERMDESSYSWKLCFPLLSHAGGLDFKEQLFSVRWMGLGQPSVGMNYQQSFMQFSFTLASFYWTSDFYWVFTFSWSFVSLMTGYILFFYFSTSQAILWKCLYCNIPFLNRQIDCKIRLLHACSNLKTRSLQSGAFQFTNQISAKLKFRFCNILSCI